MFDQRNTSQQMSGIMTEQKHSWKSAIS